MTHFLNIYVDIFIIVFYLPYYCSIRYVVLSFDEIKTHYYLLLYMGAPTERNTFFIFQEYKRVGISLVKV